MTLHSVVNPINGEPDYACKTSIKSISTFAKISKNVMEPQFKKKYIQRTQYHIRPAEKENQSMQTSVQVLLSSYGRQPYSWIGGLGLISF